MRRASLGLFALALMGGACARDNPAFGLDGGAGSGGGLDADDDDDDGGDGGDGADDDDDDTADDDDDDTADDDDDDTADDDDDDDASCPASHVCLPLPGPPWMGPVALDDTIVTPMLPGDCAADPYTDQLESGFLGGWGTPNNQCCTCEPPATACAQPILLQFNDGRCGKGDGLADFNPSCDAPPTADGMSYELEAPDPALGGGCATQQLNSPPPPMAEGRALVCDGAQAAGACSAGACLPEPGGDFLGPCIIAEGHDEPCPAAYPKRTEIYDLQDDRVCDGDSCACGKPMGGECDAALILHAGEKCGRELDAYGVGECIPAEDFGRVDSISAFSDVAEDGSCDVINGEPEGEVYVVDPWTVCCR